MYGGWDVRISAVPLEARKGVRSPRAGLAGDREPPDVGAVNQLGSSARTAYALSLVFKTSSLLNTYTYCHCFSEYFILFHFNEAFRPAYKINEFPCGVFICVPCFLLIVSVLC